MTTISQYQLRGVFTAILVLSVGVAGCSSCQNCGSSFGSEKGSELPPYKQGEIEPTEANGVGGTAAYVQTFVADGEALHDLELMVSEGEQEPDEPLIVEVRNERMDRRLGYGEIESSSAPATLDWTAVDWERKPTLEVNQNYAIVMHSEAELGSWLIASGLNLYPFGEVSHNGGDTGFRMRFSDGTVTESLLRPPTGEVESSSPAGGDDESGSVYNMSSQQYMKLPMSMCEGSRCGPLYSISSDAGPTAAKMAVSVTPKIARAQKFIAEASSIEKFELLLIPPESTDAGDLFVEIRSVDLTLRYGRGVIKASAAREYGWHAVEWEEKPDLESDTFFSMVLLLQPRASARWHIAVGNGYRWSDMTHWNTTLTPVDLGFRIRFEGGEVIDAGLKASSELPTPRGKAKYRKDEMILNEANGSHGDLLPLCRGRRCVTPPRDR